MKRLLTFIYGMLHVAIACYFEYKFDHEHEWYRWFYFALIITMVLAGIDKMDKATE